MATDLNPFKEIAWMVDGIVPAVDGADLKSVWSLPKVKEHFEQQASGCLPKEGSNFDINYLKSVCGHGSNAAAVWHRLRVFETLRRSIEFGSVFSRLVEGKPTDAVFKVLATVPMPMWGPQAFNIFELVSLIQKESEARR
jgi:hypothetical protein